jgi:hypothetical protein
MTGKRAAWIAAVLLAMGCSIPYHSGSGASAAAQESEIRAMLIAELRRRASAHPAPDSTSTRFADIPSTAVPDLIYHWGMYYPRSIPEGQFSAIVMERNAKLSLLATPSDWIEAAGMFMPMTPHDALAACREMILTTVPSRSPTQPFGVYLDQASIDSLPLAVPDPDKLRRHLSPPEMAGTSTNGWRIRLWIVHRRIVRRYQCRLENGDGGLAVLDSLPGYGFY